MNIKDTVVKHISNLDIEMMSLFLDDKETYNGASKEMYLGKLEGVFNTFKANGNTKLIPNASVCNNPQFQSKDCYEYFFFGNVSNDYMCLYIQEKDGILTDIQNCSDIFSDKIIDSNQIEVIIYAEEQLNFVPNIEYLLLVQNCETALNDLKERYNNKLTKAECFYWLSKNEQLRIASPCHRYGGIVNKFYNTFDEISYITSFLNKEKDANNALVKFNSINLNDDYQLFVWLVKYKEIGLDLELFYYENSFADTEKIKDGFLPLKNNAEVSLLVSDYNSICQFLIVFIKNYSNYKAYFVSSEDEEIWY